MALPILTESIFTKSSVLISIDQTQRQEPMVIDLENESTSMSTFISSSTDPNKTRVKKKDQIKPNASSGSSSTKRTNAHRPTEYLPQWEKEPETYYRTIILDSFGELKESRQCWLRRKIDENGKITIGCFLCNKHRMTLSANRRTNPWVTYEYSVLSLTKIKEHGTSNEKHIEAQKKELDIKSKSQPDWKTTQSTVNEKHQQAIENLMCTAVFICQNDYPLNSFEQLCNLQENNGVILLPAEVSGVNYRNDCAALCFLQHTARILHQELLEKLNQSPILGWLMDESTSRTCEKSCIIYVRYLENFRQKTDFYGLINMNGDGSAQNIVDKLSALWDEDRIDVKKTCWLATDNASTFTGVHNGVAAKLKKKYRIDYLELNTCAAHTFALVGSHAGKEMIVSDDGINRMKVRDDLDQFESNIGEIYNFFRRSACRLSELKQWQNFLDLPETKFKHLFDIRWSSIRDCLKPIISNVKPGHQALFATLKQISEDERYSRNEREKALDLYNSISNDSFLFYLHFHHDLQECVSGELTKMMQDDDMSYTILKNKIQEKKDVLKGWLTIPSSSNIHQHVEINSNLAGSTLSYSWGPSLSKYIELTSKSSYGAFLIDKKTRTTAESNCRLHIERFLSELERRFTISQVQECLSMLFDPAYLYQNDQRVRQVGYGRNQLSFLSKKYNLLDDFDPCKVASEWESLKPSLISYISAHGKGCSRKLFWKEFVLLQQSINVNFIDDYKNILLLVNVYLVSPTNSAECERGFSASNRIQTNGRSRLMINTLNTLLTVRLLLRDDIRSKRCHQVIEKSFRLWNNPDENRRWKRTKLIIDVPDDYEPARQTRPNNNKKKRPNPMTTRATNPSRPKRPKATAMKCANGCGRMVSYDDPFQKEAIQCCHQVEFYDWIDDTEQCSRWLCNYCRIKFAIPTDSISWFCEDHIDMHMEDDSFEERQSDEMVEEMNTP